MIYQIQVMKKWKGKTESNKIMEKIQENLKQIQLWKDTHSIKRTRTTQNMKFWLGLKYESIREKQKDN